MIKQKRLCVVCGKEVLRLRNKYCSRRCYVVDNSDAVRRGDFPAPPHEFGTKNSNWKGGMPRCLDCGKLLTQRTYKRCKSCSRKGELNVNYKLEPKKCSRWRGGVTRLYHSIRNLFEYRQWRSDVFTRDSYTCQECGVTNKYLHSHHKESFLSIITRYDIKTTNDAISCVRLWDINNGITFCRDCHKIVHKTLKGNKL